ncbi:hypothetical protein DFR69_12215 [Nocardia neocaledoniensis]|uniref:Uncharacterized protein n=2 Tax=Nocardia neocaledoniensis TaxID=236511 RepID=A0A317N1X6_9NOCA|nr:hypothetical protein DFR69_12215 [Nocardia neocaledoniensis]
MVTDVGKDLGNTGPISTTGIATRFGIPEANQRRFQSFADRYAIVIDVRPANPATVHWLEVGALPKPTSIKAKSINQLDTALGASSDHVGLIGHFEPTMPTRLPSGVDSTALHERFDMRRNEFHILRPEMNRLVATGDYAIRDGVVHLRDDRDILRPLTCDHDLFDIRHTDGTILHEHEFWPILEEMRRADMGVQHGPHMYWQPSTQFDQQIFQTIADDHASGREPLVQFAPHTSPILTDASDAAAVARPNLTVYQHSKTTGDAGL